MRRSVQYFVKLLIITVVLSILLMEASSGIWNKKSFAVLFNADAVKDITYQVFYTTDSDEEFSEKKSVRKLVKAGKSEVEIIIPDKKIVKFRLDFGQRPDKLIINNLEINGREQVKITNFSKFYFQNIDSKELKRNQLSLSASHIDPYIEYRNNLDLRGKDKIDWNVFIIFAIFYFFLSCGVVKYLAKFKLAKNHSEIDIIFLSVFFVLLFIPMMKISDAEKNVKENRVLAMKPLLSEVFKEGGSYGADFEKWFNDRFWGRDILIKINSYIRNILITRGNDKVLIGKDGWLFDIPKIEPTKVDDETLEEIKLGVSAYKKFCDENNFKCYIQIVPRRLEFTKDKVFRKVSDKEKDLAYIITEFLKQDGTFDISYPLKELKEANKKDFIFFKQDHHWTDIGAYAGYLALMEKIMRDFPELNVLTKKDMSVSYSNKIRAEFAREYTIGRQSVLLGLSKDMEKSTNTYKFFDFDDEKLAIDKNSDLMNLLSFNDTAKNKQRVAVIGNSFVENLMPFILHTFPVVLKFRCNNKEGDNIKLSRWKKQIISFKPDIMIILVESEYSSHLKDLND